MRISDWSSDVCSSDRWTRFDDGILLGCRVEANEPLVGGWLSLCEQSVCCRCWFFWGGPSKPGKGGKCEKYARPYSPSAVLEPGFFRRPSRCPRRCFPSSTSR